MSQLGHPEGLPELFLDRSLGRYQVPRRLREHGLALRTLAEFYGVPQDQDIADTTWLRDTGTAGWAVLMKDDRIRYRDVERTALLTHGVRAFCLANANLRATEMAELFLGVLPKMTECCREPGPFLHIVTARGLRRVSLDP